MFYFTVNDNRWGPGVPSWGLDGWLITDGPNGSSINVVTYYCKLTLLNSITLHSMLELTLARRCEGNGNELHVWKTRLVGVDCWLQRCMVPKGFCI